MKSVIKQLTYLLLIMVLVTTTIFADTISDLEDEQEANEAAQEANAEAQAQLQIEIDEINANIKVLDDEIAAFDLLIADYEGRLELKRGEIEIAKGELDQAIQEEEAYYEQMKERMKVMYEYGDSGYLQILLESKDIGDFFSRLEFLSQIFEYDENMFENLEEIQQNIVATEMSLESEEQELQSLSDEANEQRDAKEQKAIEKNLEMEKLFENKELLAYQQILLEEEEEQITENLNAAIEAARNAGQQINFSSGTFSWPSNDCYTISSPFGYRIHPITGKNKLHTGIDIPASGGSDVLAAASGTIITSTYNSGYGNYIAISHGTYEGSTYVTYYAHNSVLLYEEGEWVAEGTVIAKVGTTGSSTGNHIHFGVLKDGEWVDPLDYFESY